MAHECGCQGHTAGTTESGGASITAGLTVGDVAHHHPGTLSIVKEMGINHCCGAHLTLREAAASAGVALEALLDALNRPATVKV